MLKRLTASLSAQGLQPDLIVDLTGCSPDDGAPWARLWRRTGAEGGFTADEPLSGELIRPDGAMDAQGLFRTFASSGAAGGPRVLAIPQALAGPATLAELPHAGVDAFAVAATGRTGAGNWAPIVRDAFDTGYVSLAGKGPPDKAVGPSLIVFLRSDLVQVVDRLGGLNRGVVSMTTLGRNGRFANQLMQYAYVKLYALRHGLRPAVPHWTGADLYGRQDSKPDGGGCTELRFFAFDNDDLHLWRMADPPIDIDLWGYFQELPACWKPHRALLRYLYTLPPAFADPLEQRLSEATGKGRRDLVAVHVRRGDYRMLHGQGLPWYRPVPEEWYVAWLRRILPRLRNPVVYVATDEPETVLPAFAEFEPVGTGAFGVPGLAADVLDFEIMRRARYLAIANSSFSRMAAILASETQVCVCPDFEQEAFVAYEPWPDDAFWRRFEAEPKAEAFMGYSPDAQGARSIMIHGELGRWRRDNEALKAYLGERETALRNYEEEVRRWEKRVFELEAEQERSRREREADALRVGEQSRRAAEDIELGRKQVGDLERRLAEREAANGVLAETIEERSRQHAMELERWRKRIRDLEEALHKAEADNRELGMTLDEHARREAKAVERWRAEVEELKAERSRLVHRVSEHEDRLRRADAEADEARRRLDAMARDQQAARERLRHLVEIENELERQRRLARRHQEAVSALRAAALDERTRENFVPRVELDRALALVRLPSGRDYLKLVVFWPVGWLLRQAVRLVRAHIPILSGKLEDLAELIDRRQYRSFIGQFGRSLLRAPRRIGRRVLRRPVSASLAAPAPAPAAGSGLAAALPAPRPVPPDAPAPAKVYVEITPRAHDDPVVLVLGSCGPDALAATLESLAAQTLRPGDIRVSPGEDGFACRPGNLVCIVAAGARLDPTALELLAAALLSVPGCTFAAAPGAPGDDAQAGGGERIAACLIPGRIWQLGEDRGLGTVQGEGLLDALLGTVMQSIAGQGLLLPLPLAAWTSEPGSGFAASAWPAVRATPDQGELWSASPLDGAARVETFIASNPAGDDGDARPHLLVVVPWLPIGGSEIVLLEVLERVAERWAISIVTTLPSDHGMRAAFARLTDEIYHAGDVFDAFRLQAFVSGLIAARGSRIVLSSNSGHLYRALPELKAAHPEVVFIDILHNDLPTGHIRSAVEISTSLDRHVAVSRRVGEALVARGVPRERVIVVPNGVDAEVFSPQAVDRRQARAALGLGEDALVLAFVGRFSEEKRAGAFAEIVSRVSKHVPVRAIAVGEGQEEADLRARIAAEGLPIEIVPKMPRSDLAGLYAAADLLVLTSTIEGMPMVVLEAMATGCPAAVTDVGDVRRVVEPGISGFIVPVDAPETLADLIVAAAREPGRLARMRAAACAAVMSKGMTKATMLEGYNRLLAAAGRLERAGFDRADAAL